MSGHSKWATTKHKKAVIDQRRAKSFAKLIKNIEVAAKIGGADLSGNPTLVDAVQKAKKTSVPNDNIDRAIKRGAGLTRRDRRLHDDHVRGLRPQRRRASDRVPHRQQEPRGGRGAHRDDPQRRHHGRPGQRRLQLPPQGRHRRSARGRDRRGRRAARRARRRRRRGHRPRARPSRSSPTPTDLVATRTALQEAGIDYDSADVEFVATLKVEVDAETARKVFRLIDALEDSRRRAERLHQPRPHRRGPGRARAPTTE